MKPLLIEIDGPEYAGKSTTVQELKKRLNGFKFFRTPGSAPIAEKLRPIVKECTMTPEVAVGIMLASMGDFYQYVAKENSNSITDRGLISSIIYQGHLNNCFNKCYNLYNTCFNTLKDIVETNFDYYRIILSITPETVIKRKSIRDAVESNEKDKYDNMNYEGHAQLCKYYHSIGTGAGYYDKFLNSDKTYMIECDNLSQNEVVEKVVEIVKKLTKI